VHRWCMINTPPGPPLDYLSCNNCCTKDNRRQKEIKWNSLYQVRTGIGRVKGGSISHYTKRPRLFYFNGLVVQKKRYLLNIGRYLGPFSGPRYLTNIVFLELATSGIEPKLAVHETTVLPIHFLAYHTFLSFRSNPNFPSLSYLNQPGAELAQAGSNLVR
jgi:hypothetical protein